MAPAPRSRFGPVLVVAVVPMMLILWRIAEAGINLPFFDQWFPGSSVDVALAAHARKLRFEALWQPNFEHRLLFTHLSTALLARFGNWNVKLEMGLSVVLTGLAVLLVLVRLHGVSTRPLSIWVAALISGLMFGLRQQNNWLWGFQTQWYFALLFVVLTLTLLSGPTLGAARVTAAALTAEAASVSFGSGILAWPLGFLLLALRAPGRIGLLLGWPLACTLSLWVQLHGQRVAPGGRSGPLTVWLIGRVRFILATLGAPLWPDRPALLGVVTVTGAVALLALVWITRKLLRRGVPLRGIAFLLGLSAYAIGSAMLVALSNRGVPASNALFGRYTTNGTLLHVAVVGLAWLLLEPGTGRSGRADRPVAALAIVGTASLFVLASVMSWRPPPFLASPDHLACVDAYVREGRSECFDGLYPVQFTEVVRLPELASAGLTAFSGRGIPVGRPPQGENRSADPREALGLMLGEPRAWRPSADLTRDRRDPDAWILGEGPSWVHLGAIHRCLGDFDRLVLSLTVSGPMGRPQVHVYYTLGPAEDFDEGHSFLLPILADGAPHRYEFELRSLHLPERACDFRLRIDPGALGDGEHTRLRVHEATLAPPLR